jgi:hypothetical protein
MHWRGRNTCRVIDMRSTAQHFAIAPGATVAISCSPKRNLLMLDSANGPPVVGAGAALYTVGCDIMTLTTAEAKKPDKGAKDLFGNEPDAVVTTYKGTVLSNCNVCTYASHARSCVDS